MSNCRKHVSMMTTAISTGNASLFWLLELLQIRQQPSQEHLPHLLNLADTVPQTDGQTDAHLTLTQ